MTRRPTHLLAALALAATVTLTGCASTTSSSYTTGTDVRTGTDTTDITGTPATASAANPANYTVTKDLTKAPDITINPNSGNVTELYTRDIVAGSGKAVSDPTQQVTVQYTGIGAVTKKTFDSSWTRNAPIQFALNQVIPGWTQGLIGMKPGGRRLIVIPADLAYGTTPPTPAIQSGETLVFVVDLVSTP
jgi:peptidylprolyl isomerase